MSIFYFTFPGRSIFYQHYVKIEASSEEAARVLMMNTFGVHWAFCYAPDRWVRDGVSQAELYGLQLLVVVVETPAGPRRGWEVMNNV